MHLVSSEIDAVRRIVASNNLFGLQHQNLEGITLAATLELACCFWTWQRNHSEEASELVRSWSQQNQSLEQAINALIYRHWPTTNVLASPLFEICPVPFAADISSDRWTMYEDRFARSLERHGDFGRKLSLALSKALHEMVDNVIQHSSATVNHPALGVVGYHISRRVMTFAVADVGRGVLNSLRTNPRWSSLLDSSQALQLAVSASATRRVGDDHEDGGFERVLEALADLNGLLRFRSGNGLLTIDGRGQARQATSSYSQPMDGLQLSVTCRLDDDLQELFL